jgi:hypothetical protein
VDLLRIRARALEEGMPYQTLIASVLYKYVAGRLANIATTPRVRTRRRTPSPG